MKAALYGGTFDPIHYGHLITAGYVLAVRKPDLILFVPANVSPFKHGIKSASASDRLNMAKLAISGNQFFSVTDYEIEKAEEYFASGFGGSLIRWNYLRL
ncbi:MAG: adenylyltransferase/cytidyltransferase family protein, partial [Ignavibacteriaceae bacterium]|nr:adenylyltransferase/cytidyltransferase family protein [Ignavibacteriaceae bacterium]